MQGFLIVEEINEMIRLAEKKDFYQLAEMRWQHSAEDDSTYGTTNVVGVDKRTFVWLKNRNFKELGA